MKKQILICCIVIVYMGGVVQGARIRKNNVNKWNSVKVISSHKNITESGSMNKYEIVLTNWTLPMSQLYWADSIMQMYQENSLPGIYIVDGADTVEMAVYLTIDMWQQNMPYFVVEYNTITRYCRIRRRRKALCGMQLVLMDHVWKIW